jgi:hypothetical protein
MRTKKADSVGEADVTDNTALTAEAALPALPGAAALAPELLDRAVDDINRLYRAHGLETARAIGEYVVATFFAGDLDAALGRARSHATWRALADRDDLLVSHSHLWSCVQVLEQRRRLPEGVGAALSISHHRRLLSVRDTEARARLAEAAVAEELTVRELEERVAAQRAAARVGERPGRKPLPKLVKALRALRRVELGALGSPDELGALRDEQAAEVLAEIEGQLRALEALRERVRGARVG